jgi:hypothetical protein
MEREFKIVSEAPEEEPYDYHCASKTPLRGNWPEWGLGGRVMNYSKIKDWHDGAPDEFRPGMILETALQWKIYWLIGDINTFRSHTPVKEPASALENEYIIRWAWLPGFEGGNDELG